MANLEQEDQGQPEIAEDLLRGAETMAGLITYLGRDQNMNIPVIPTEENQRLSLALGRESARYINLSLRALQIQPLAQALHANLDGRHAIRVISTSTVPTEVKGIELTIGLTVTSGNVTIPTLIAGRAYYLPTFRLRVSEEEQRGFQQTAAQKLFPDGIMDTSLDFGISPYAGSSNTKVLLAARQLKPIDFVTQRNLFPPFVKGMTKQCRSLQEKISNADWGAGIDQLHTLVSVLEQANALIESAFPQENPSE